MIDARGVTWSGGRPSFYDDPERPRAPLAGPGESSFTRLRIIAALAREWTESGALMLSSRHPARSPPHFSPQSRQVGKPDRDLRVLQERSLLRCSARNQQQLQEHSLLRRRVMMSRFTMKRTMSSLFLHDYTRKPGLGGEAASSTAVPGGSDATPPRVGRQFLGRMNGYGEEGPPSRQFPREGERMPREDAIKAKHTVGLADLRWGLCLDGIRPAPTQNDIITPRGTGIELPGPDPSALWDVPQFLKEVSPTAEELCRSHQTQCDILYKSSYRVMFNPIWGPPIERGYAGNQPMSRVDSMLAQAPYDPPRARAQFGEHSCYPIWVRPRSVRTPYGHSSGHTRLWEIWNKELAATSRQRDSGENPRRAYSDGPPRSSPRKRCPMTAEEYEEIEALRLAADTCDPRILSDAMAIGIKGCLREASVTLYIVDEATGNEIFSVTAKRADPVGDVYSAVSCTLGQTILQGQLELYYGSDYLVPHHRIIEEGLHHKAIVSLRILPRDGPPLLRRPSEGGHGPLYATALAADVLPQ